MLEAAITGTNSLDDKKMAAWLKANEVKAIIGDLRFDGPNNHGPDQSKVKQVIDKKWVVVWPTEYAPPGVKAMLP
jgi:branched-chain amino acid transport system substrate-binding protein